MPVQATPPVLLDPSQDTGHQIAFINQNFQNIGNVLQQNSFIIVQEGSVSITGTGSGSITHADVTHDLGIIPIVLAFISLSDGSGYIPLPAPLASTFVSTTFTISEYIAIGEITNHDFFFTYYKGSSGSATFTIKYYVLQQTAN